MSERERNNHKIKLHMKSSSCWCCYFNGDFLSVLSLSPFSLRNSMISSAALPMHYNISYNMRRKETKRFIKSQLYPKCLFTMEYNDEFVMVRYRKENRLDTVTVKRVRRHTKQNYSDKILSKYLSPKLWWICLCISILKMNTSKELFQDAQLCT